ncbi:PQQ-binding-like beta-propeller repeat protein [Gracilinema caldarium]|uniref:Pyrrolo-quinoline quinone repeat-containing protein n=1 Tax=Gracilinema caldarium (strain ATCC 51460 / DSM 7334 / H1) TaxID=744872 RepID=F8EX96_GRAC1|nr:PQQ-binding-like beta-propeller repeat protein [Gracilinema caldarium]AEJ18839.1 Pyrrolo-quinoline quinone repeat-containing protein [Gracilinema caldarium DSM 7334]
MNKRVHFFGSLFILSTLFGFLIGCQAGSKESITDNNKRDFAELITTDTQASTQESSEPPSSIQPVLVFLQGSVNIQRQGQAINATEGLTLEAGDIISTGIDGSAEIAYGSLGTLRLLPRTIVSLTVIISRALNQSDRDSADITLIGGTLAAKVKKLSSKDEFLVLTPNCAAGVRGTQFIVSYEEPLHKNGTITRTERTLVAVREGSVAVLPKGKLLTSLIDGRQSSPLAGAVVTTALALAPKAGPGQEVSIGGQETASGIAQDETLIHQAESVYGTLVGQAENLQARGTDFDTISDPIPILAASGSDTSKAFTELSRIMPALLQSEYSRQLLEVLDRMRDPGSDKAPLPASLPERYFSLKTKDESDKTTASKKLTYPGLVYSHSLSSAAFTGMISRSGNTLLIFDALGNLYALNPEGKQLWTHSALVAFTALDTTVALLESQALRLYDAVTKSERGLYPFDSWQALPQAKPVPIPNGIALATPRGVTILRQENAELLAEIPVLGGLISPLVLADSHLIAVSGQGKLVFIDIKNNRISEELELNFKDDVLTPRFKDGKVFIATKNGRLVAVDVTTHQTIWDVDLGQGIRVEPEVDGERIYLWVQNKSLVIVSIQNGTPFGKPIPDVESPPLLAKGRLYWGGSGPSLVVADSATGTILKRSPLPDKVSARPLLVDGILYLGTSTGKFIRLDIEKL